MINLKINKRKVKLSDYRKKNINLLPPEYIERSKKNYYVIFMASSLIIMSIAGIWYYMLLKDTLHDYEEKIAVIKKEIGELNGVKNEQMLLQYLQEKIDFKADLLKRLEEKHHSSTLLFAILERNMPRDMVLVTLSLDSEENMSITGVAKDRDDITEYLYNLNKEKYFQKVFVETINTINYLQNKVVYEEYGFTINFKFKDDNNES